MHKIPNMQVLLCNQYHLAKACSCCCAHNTKHELLLCNQYHSAKYQTCSCCYATKTKHAAVAMKPISLSLKMQLLLCTQNQACSCCYEINITQFKYAAVAICTVPHMQPLPCKLCHTVYIRIYRHVHMLPSHKYSSKFLWSNLCNFCAKPWKLSS